MKSQRISVSGRNLQFLVQLSQDMDEQSLTEVLSYLLTDVRLLNYQIGSKPQPRQQQPQQTSLGYSFEPSNFEITTPSQECDTVGALRDRNYQEIDPIIARLSSLIEEF